MSNNSAILDCTAFISTASAKFDNFSSENFLVNIGITLPKNNATLSLNVAPPSYATLVPLEASDDESVVISQKFLDNLNSNSFDEMTIFAMILSFLENNSVKNLIFWSEKDLEKLDFLAKNVKSEKFSEKFSCHFLNFELKNVRIFDQVSKNWLFLPKNLNLAANSAKIPIISSQKNPSLAAARILLKIAKKFDYRLEIVPFEMKNGPQKKAKQAHLATKRPQLAKFEAPANISSQDSSRLAHLECCPVCYEDAPLFAVYSCGHVVSCAACALLSLLILKEKKCGVCREKTSTIAMISAEEAKKVTKKLLLTEFKALQNKKNTSFWQKSELVSAPKIYHSYLDSLFSPRCYLCDSSFKNFAALRNHILAQHELHMCNECVENKAVLPSLQQFYSKKELENHLKSGLVEEAPFSGHTKCEFCGKYFYDQAAYEKHLKEKHQKCEICYPAAWFADIAAYEEHIFAKHFVCTLCRPSTVTINNKEVKHMIVFDSKEGLQQHLRDVHYSAAPKKLAITPEVTPAPQPKFSTLPNKPPKNSQHYMPFARYSVDSVMTAYKTAKKNKLKDNTEELFYRYVLDEITAQQIALPPNFSEQLATIVLPEFFWNSELGLWNIKRTYENVPYEILDKIYKVLEDSMKVTLTFLKQTYENQPKKPQSVAVQTPAINVHVRKSKKKAPETQPATQLASQNLAINKPSPQPAAPSKTGLILGRSAPEELQKPDITKQFNFTYRKSKKK